MRTMYLETAVPARRRSWALPVALGDAPRTIALGAIVLLAAILRFANIGALGYDNTYYAAGVEAMLQSWRNFFFVAAEPGGSVSIDKPPVGFWLQAISAHFLGVNTLGLLLPQILAGIISVVVVYHLVRRSFGTVAGLVAALALAVAPISIATDRNNTIDSTLILTLLLAAWAFIVATERRSLKHLLIGAVLVGVGFNIKMMEAFLPLPAFYGLYLLGSSQSLRRKLANLSLASVVLLVVSLSWAMAVDLTPASQRPYVGSSGNNSELSLAFGYNGVERLLGMNGRGGLLSGLLGGFQSNAAPAGSQTGDSDGRTDGVQPQSPTGSGSASPQAGSSTDSSTAQQPFGPQGGPGGPGGAGGMFNTGIPGPLRLFTGSLGKDIGWLLPFGVFSMALLALRSRLRWPVGSKHQAVILWGGWLITGAVFFSVAGFFHEHYLTLLAPPLAALVGIGVVDLWGIRTRYPWISAALAGASVGGTIVFQIITAREFTSATWWAVPTVLVLVAGAGLLASAARTNRTHIAVVGLGCIVAAMLITPTVWSALTAMDPATSGQSPYAYSGQGNGQGFQGPGGGVQLSQVNQSMLEYLEANTQGTKYLMIVGSSMQGADYVLATGRPVLYAGGFNGEDPVITAADLTRMAAAGEFKYIYWGGGMGPGQGNKSDIASWIAANTVPVTGFGTQSSTTSSQDGSASAPSTHDGGRFQGPGGMQQGTLYQVVFSS